MRFKELIQAAKGLCAPATPGTVEHSNWLGMKDVLAFVGNSTTECVPLYVSGDGPYINSLFVPRTLLQGDFRADMQPWSFAISSGWASGYVSSGGNHVSKCVFPPVQST